MRQFVKVPGQDDLELAASLVLVFDDMAHVSQDQDQYPHIQGVLETNPADPVKEEIDVDRTIYFLNTCLTKVL